MPNFKSKGFSSIIAIVIILLLAGGLAGGAFYYQTKTSKKISQGIQEKQEKQEKQTEKKDKEKKEEKEKSSKCESEDVSHELLSHDGEKSAFVCGFSDQEQIRVRNNSVKEEKILSSQDCTKSICSCKPESWSPNDKYLLVDCGTSPARSKKVYEVYNGEKVVSFGTTGYSYFWLNEEEIVFLQYQRVDPIRPWGDGASRGIAKINLSTEETQVFKEATPTKGYKDIELLENGNIKYTLRTVSSPEDWGDKDKYIIYNGIMNQQGNTISETKE